MQGEEAKRVPQLRFPEFEGEWEEKKLSDIGRIIGGGTPSTQDPSLWGEDYMWYTPSEIKYKYLKSSIRKISKKGLHKSSAKILPAGTLILSTRATVGDIGITLIEATTNQGFQNIIVNELNSNEFIYYVILTIKDELLKKSSGSTFLELSNSEVKKIRICLPSKGEQQKIADFLGAVDERVDLLAQKLELLREYKQGVMQKIFNQEIRFTKEDGSTYPDWEEKKLKEIINMIVDNRGKTPPLSKTGYNLIEVNALGSKQVNYGSIKKFISEETYNTWPRKYLKSGDVLFTTVGQTALCSYYIATKSIIAQNIVGLRTESENSLFLYYLLSETKNNRRFKRIEMGAVQPSIKVSQMIHIKFKFPAIEEQEKIANFLSSIDNKIELMQNQLAQTKQYKKSLLQQMLV